MPQLSLDLKNAPSTSSLYKELFIYSQIHDASNNDLAIARDIWKIEEGRFN